jgi:hypothetical protein
MRCFVVAALACGIIGSPLCAAEGADSGRTLGDQRTATLLNGRFWMGLADLGEDVILFKTVFVMAATDGLSETPPQKRSLYIPGSLTNAETVAALDAFYKVPENLPVPVMWALSVVSLRAKGGSQADVEALAARCRKRAAASNDAR